MANAQIGGAAELRKLARQLKGARLSPALQRALLEAAGPAVRAARAEPVKRLPDRGGLAQRVARTNIVVRPRVSGRGAGVRILALKGSGTQGVADPAAINRGRVMHPVFGNRRGQQSVVQLVRRGWFSDPIAQQAPQVRRRVEAAVNAELGRLTRGT